MSFPEVEAMVVAFLAAVVDPVPVGTKVPSTNGPEDRFVRAVRTGGSASNRVVERAQITVTAEAESTEIASELASACREHFLNRYTLMPLVRGVEEITGPCYNPDPTTGKDRYTFTVALTVRASRN